ncbi:MAG TPA: DUF4132 domain-containing protein [Labilithrix sp.]|nr:DUF4132 domain-containing protein [Labilithrix sp.]
MAEVPSVLVDPPWHRVRAAAPEPPVAKAVAIVEPPRVVWLEGERERFLGPPARAISADAEERLYERLLEDLDRPKPPAVADLARVSDAHLSELRDEMRSSHIDEKVLRHLLARLGDDHAAHAVRIVRAAMPVQGLFEALSLEVMAPLRAAELVLPAAQLFAQRELPNAEMLARPFVMKPADAWLLRFADLAAPLLAAQDDKPSRAALAWIAASLGMIDAIPSSHHVFLSVFTPLAGLRRPWLAFLAARGQDAQVLGLLQGDEIAAGAPLAARAVEASTRAAELEVVPAGIPSLPAFFDPSALPAPTLLDGTPLPPDAVRVLGEMLQFSTPARPYRGLAEVRSACEPRSLDELAVAVLARWREAGEPTSDLWVLDCAAQIGGEGAAREVATRVRAWSRGAEPPRDAWDDEEHRLVRVSTGDRGWGLARAGCLALAGAGSDLALTLLDDLARNGSASWLRKQASDALDSASERRGGGKRLRAPALADDIVPDLGLDPDGTTTLDLGGRVLSVTFDETLTPRLVDADGTRHKSFPRSRKDDDPVKYARAKARFQGLVKDTASLARQQSSQLESAMCTRRAWALEAHRERFVAHPLLRHLGHGLVWALEDRSRTFRIAEDQTFADEHDAAVELASSARIVIAHPIDLDAASRARWSSLFADYAIIQPFPQLGRETFTFGEESGKHLLTRAEGKQTSRGRLFQLARRGWAARVHGGGIDEYFRELPSGAHAHLGISPPVVVGSAPADATYTLTRVSCTYALHRLPPLDFSELARDAAYLVGE